MSTRTQSAEEYLEAIFKLQRGAEPVTVKRLAGELGVAPPSVSEMIGRLRAAGLVAEPAEGRGITLTEAGNVEGATLVRRHRLSERFLVDYLDMPWDAVHDEACKLEHVLSPEVEARLAEQLGNPLTCPHGHVIPAEDGSLARRRICARCRASSRGEGRHRLHHRGEERPAPLPRLARTASGHAGRSRERGAVQRAAARARRRLAVRPRARGDRQDHGPRLTPMATTLRQSRRRAADACPAIGAARRLRRRQPQRRQVLALQLAHRLVARDGQLRRRERRRLRRLHALGGAAHRGRRPARQLLAGRAGRRPAGRPHARCSSGSPGSSSPSPTRPTSRAASTCRCSSSTSAISVVIALNLSDEARAARARAGRGGALAGPRRPRRAHRRATRRGARRSWRPPCCASAPAAASARPQGRRCRRRPSSGSRSSPCTSRRAPTTTGGARPAGSAHARPRSPSSRATPTSPTSSGWTSTGSSPNTTRALRSRSPRRGTPRRAPWRRRLRTRASPPTAGGASRPRRAPASPS